MNTTWLKALALFGCACTTGDAAPSGRPFEISTVALDSEPGVVRRGVAGSSETLFVAVTPTLSSADLLRAKSVTQSSWSILSGRHSTTTLVLTLRPESIARVQNALRLVVSQGGRLAIAVRGEVIGLLIGQTQLEGDEFTIDASFFSDGTEQEKKRASEALARDINSSLR